MNKCLFIAIIGAQLTSCGSSQSDEDFAVYRKSPIACSSRGYIDELSEQDKVHYIFGAWHSRPSSPCAELVVAEQSLDVLLLLKREVEMRGESSDPARLLEALLIKRRTGMLSAEDVSLLSLDGLCPKGDPSSRTCLRYLDELRNH